MDAAGDTPAEPEIELYDPMERDEFDVECGTFHSSAYAPTDGVCACVARGRRGGSFWRSFLCDMFELTCDIIIDYKSESAAMILFGLEL